MSRIILMAIALAVTVAGCNRFPDLTIQVTANLAPDDSSCVIDANQDTVLLRGMYDFDAPEFDYFITPRIESYIIDASIESQAPQGNIQITSFEITIKLPDGTIPELEGGLPNPYQVTTNAVIPPSQILGGTSRGAAAAPAIPESYAAAFESLITSSPFDSAIIDIRANGVTSGGFHQTSPPFSWPIDTCNGCLGIPVCESVEEIGCFPGQDVWAYCNAVVPPSTGG
jgi:hypothetical protein